MLEDIEGPILVRVEDGPIDEKDEVRQGPKEPIFIVRCDIDLEFQEETALLQHAHKYVLVAIDLLELLPKIEEYKLFRFRRTCYEHLKLSLEHHSLILYLVVQGTLD